MGVLRRLSAGRSKVLIAGVAAVGVLAAGTVAVVLGVRGGEPEASGFDCSKPVTETPEVASAAAVECDVEVEVLSARSPWESTFALPNGHLRSVISAVPSRVLVDGEWTGLDTTIVSGGVAAEQDAELGTDVAGLAPLVAPVSAMSGSTNGADSPAASPSDEPSGDRLLEVAAPVFPIELNAGGAAGAGEPLGSITREGNRLEVWFPTELPEATVDGSQAVYELADGVRLVVSVAPDGTGFAPVVELADPAAAARFRNLVDAQRGVDAPGAAGDLVFRTGLSEGLELTAGDVEGAVSVVDAAGDPQFVSAPPIMWDSAGGDLDLPDTVTEVSAGDRSVSPQMGDVIAAMPTRVDGSNLVVSPDAGMLSSPDTVWPVYVDPAFSGHGPAEWVAVRTGGYTGTLYKWNTSGGEGTGYCTDVDTCNTVFRQRLSWEFTGWDTIRNLDRDNVVQAGFTVNGIHSASCTATTTDLVMTNSLTTATTWSTIGDWSAYISSRTEAHNATCLNRGYRTWDATEALRRYAERDSPNVTMGLKPRDDSTMTSWKRFGFDAEISVEYNRPPDKPTGMKVDSPAAVCATGAADRPFINDNTPTLSAVMSDPDPGDTIQPVFAVVETGTSNVPWQSATLTGVTDNQRKAVTVGTALADDTYSWHVTATDGKLWSGWGAWCEFTLDTVRPGKPKITAEDDPSTGIKAVYTSGAERGGIGMLGKFNFGPNTITDVVKFEWTITGPPASGGSDAGTVTVGMGTSGTISFTPVAAGAATLTVKSVDRAGNKSDPVSHTIDVAAPQEDAVWMLDGSTANTGPVDAGSLTVTGMTAPTWVPGPHQLFGSRDGDKALKFDGVDDAAVSGGPVVDMKNSFVVSAFVQLDPAMVTNNKYGAVLGQDGVNMSGFRLRYNPTNSVCLDAAGAEMSGCWEFLVTGSSSSYARSKVPVKPGEWVHLVGEYDAGTSPAVRLRVCGIGTPDAPGDGEPVTVEGPRVVLPADAGGAFTLGRALHSRVAGDWFQGVIDNVRVFSGEVVDDAKVRRLCQGAEASDFGTGEAGLNALDPTVKDQ
ncbi:hypothetical protein PX701_09785 [Agromyces sp. H3Y2-19a]|uniref:LamG-like jellyroll fold domain-containing protein n=1 Tax=Agromyces chromiiresistens TaxID=3030835 RepID=UPI0023B8CB75|nr:LamG-like jellyroll fold domain-containing protein [Agromyces chromiiresistens]MDF0513908.1 hypothetical protein [Agromyces chromiiresistens]